MTNEEMLFCLQSIIMHASTLYQAIAHAPALSFAKDTASAPAYANSELKKITPPRQIA